MNQHPNPSLRRRWLQVDGLPPSAELQAVRDELDQVAHVQTLEGSSRVILYSADENGGIGPVIGALDMVPAHKERIDAKIAAAETGAAETRGHGGTDAARGDTIIRPLDLSDPDHAAALKGPRVIYDPAAEPPPIDLPDYSPDGSDPDRDRALRDAHQATLAQHHAGGGGNWKHRLFIAVMVAALAFALGFLLSGCTSAGELREHQPRAVYHSTRPPADIADCLVADINQLGGATVLERNGTTTVAFNQLGNTSLVVTIRETPTGSTVEARQLIAFFSKRSLERCTAGAN